MGKIAFPTYTYVQFHIFSPSFAKRLWSHDQGFLVAHAPLLSVLCSA